MKYKITKYTASILGLAGLFLVVITPAYAFWPFDGLKNEINSDSQETVAFPSLIQKIIDHFNLNKDEVNQVVNEYRTERQTQMETSFEDRLSKLVTDGEITEDQKNKIITKHEEIQKLMLENMQNDSSLSFEERRQKKEDAINSWQQFLSENKIDENIIPFGFGAKGMRQGNGMRGWR